jgi:hypothetical protein
LTDSLIYLVRIKQIDDVRNPKPLADDIKLGVLVRGKMSHDDINIFVDQIVPAFAALKGLHP